MTVYGSESDDFIVNVGNYVMIEAGEGNNVINNLDSFETSITSGNGNDYIENIGSLNLINLGNGVNTVNNIGAAVSITTGSGNDEFINVGDSVQIYSDSGDDYIYNEVSNFALVVAAEGNDTVFNSEKSDNVTINA